MSILPSNKICVRAEAVRAESVSPRSGFDLSGEHFDGHGELVVAFRVGIQRNVFRLKRHFDIRLDAYAVNGAVIRVIVAEVVSCRPAPSSS